MTSIIIYLNWEKSVIVNKADGKIVKFIVKNSLKIPNLNLIIKQKETSKKYST